MNGTVQVITGGSQTVNLSFTTDDGKAATSLQVTQNLAALPAGWSASSTSVSCAQIVPGSGCVLLLRYAPITAANGAVMAKKNTGHFGV